MDLQDALSLYQAVHPYIKHMYVFKRTNEERYKHKRGNQKEQTANI